MNRHIHSGLYPLALFVVSTFVAAGADDGGWARKVVDASGVAGGLIVHVGCGEGQQTAALRVNDSYQVFGLDRDAAKIAAGRKKLVEAGKYGPIALDAWRGKQLPFKSDTVNLLVVSDGGWQAPSGEVARVLAPRGVVDDWPQYLHDGGNNAVAADKRAGPPKAMQWDCGPTWSRHHDRLSSVSAVVVEKGRLLWIIDLGSPHAPFLPSRWLLEARDAWSGTRLWRRDIPKWWPVMYPFKSMPSQLPRRLAADGERVYVTLDIAAPVSVLDAKTGKTLQTLAGTERTEEMVFGNGVLITVTGGQGRTKPYRLFPKGEVVGLNEEAERARRFEDGWDKKERDLIALDMVTGRERWRKRTPVVPMSPASTEKGVFIHDGKSIVCYDPKSGNERWRSEPVTVPGSIPVCYGATLVQHGDRLYFAIGDITYNRWDRRKKGEQKIKPHILALNVSDGSTVWKGDYSEGGHYCPDDLFVIGDSVWYVGNKGGPKEQRGIVRRSVATGEITKLLRADYGFHQRCYRNKATERFVIQSNTGLAFYDVANFKQTKLTWARGACGFGFFAANGFLYVPPQPCACYIEAKQTGLSVLGARVPGHEKTPRLEKGPGFSSVGGSDGSVGSDGSDRSGTAAAQDWPTYRGDNSRSGFTTQKIGTPLSEGWKVKLGGKLSRLTCANGTLYVAAVDRHQLYALDAAKGQVKWSYIAGGRIDSPPTLHAGRVYFGSHDGWVYCLRQSDGKLVWRFRAALDDRKLMSYDQVESVWPVPGSVTIRDGVLYTVAGRSMFLDRGIRLCRIDPMSGELLGEKVHGSRNPRANWPKDKIAGINTSHTMPVALPDILVSGRDALFMRSQQFELDGTRKAAMPEVQKKYLTDPHLFVTTGFVDDNSFHRSVWIYSQYSAAGPMNWGYAAWRFPAGTILCLDKDNVYGYGHTLFSYGTPRKYRLFSAPKNPPPEPKKPAPKGKKGRRRRGPRLKTRFNWQQPIPFHARALVVADKTIFAVGPPTVLVEHDAFKLWPDEKYVKQAEEDDKALKGEKGAQLWAVSTETGEKVSELQLPAVPVFDGLIAARGRLYLSSTDGSVSCLKGN